MGFAIRPRASCLALLAPVLLVACGGRLEGPTTETDSGNAPTADTGAPAPPDASDDGLDASYVDIDASDVNADADAGTDAPDEDAGFLPPPPLSTTCPDPTAVVGGKSCAGIVSGLTCRGNPTVCNGGMFYDALQCDGATWISLASTVCGIDGG